VVGTRREIDQLPIRGQALGQARTRNILDQRAEQPFVQLLGETELFSAPFRLQPILADQEQHDLATVRRLVQRPLPAFARRDAARRVEVEKGMVVPAAGDDPIAQRHGCCVVLARMAQKDSRHGFAHLVATNRSRKKALGADASVGADS
jgi:hypothetical protein